MCGWKSTRERYGKYSKRNYCMPNGYVCHWAINTSEPETRVKFIRGSGKKSSGVRKSSLKAKGGWKNWGEEWKKGHLMTWKEHVQRHAPFLYVSFPKCTCLLRPYCWQSWRWLWRSILQDRHDLTWHSRSVQPLGATLCKTPVYFALLPSLGDLPIASHVVLHLKLLPSSGCFSILCLFSTKRAQFLNVLWAQAKLQLHHKSQDCLFVFLLLMYVHFCWPRSISVY